MRITLKSARINAGYDLKTASFFIGKTPSALSNYETGVRAIKGLDLETLLAKYDRKFEEIILPTKASIKRGR